MSDLMTEFLPMRDRLITAGMSPTAAAEVALEMQTLSSNFDLGMISRMAQSDPNPAVRDLATRFEGLSHMLLTRILVLTAELMQAKLALYLAQQPGGRPN
jgi:hypothetical protein